MNQKVVITGPARGIGYEVAKVLARSGDTVIGFDRDGKGIERLKKEMDRIGAPHFLSCLDITDVKGVKKFRDAVLKEFGTVDAVISNAAVASFGAFEEADLDGMLESLTINVLGTARIFQAFIPAMRRRGDGRLIAMSSFTGIVPFPFESIDTACNFAIEGLVRAFRCEVEPFGIEVGLIEPSIVLTDLTAGIHTVPPAGSPYRERIQRFLAKDREMKKDAMVPTLAAQKIVKIIKGKKLKLHNRIDFTSALFLSIDKFLPAGLRDAILLNQMNIKP
ncbi:MAG: SDR family NAD(P)-dependent oxidoreductase [Deltaproteobacteria bacterium]|nr:SDR family NAD(P)-dependent oxidoreductase [Candidatus Zymogenaceae bacterium]